ncbi:MAG: hypothetical protein RIS47_504 [Bacteroidota bacterium]|jgi:hypothetical protein
MGGFFVCCIHQHKTLKTNTKVQKMIMPDVNLISYSIPVRFRSESKDLDFKILELT